MARDHADQKQETSTVSTYPVYCLHYLLQLNQTNVMSSSLSHKLHPLFGFASVCVWVVALFWRWIHRLRHCTAAHWKQLLSIATTFASFACTKNLVELLELEECLSTVQSDCPHLMTNHCNSQLVMGTPIRHQSHLPYICIIIIE